MAKLKAGPGAAEDAPTFVGTPAARDPSAPLDARPVEGEVDFRGMRKQIAADFPKTLAKLAE